MKLYSLMLKSFRGYKGETTVQENCLKKATRKSSRANAIMNMDTLAMW